MGKKNNLLKPTKMKIGYSKVILSLGNRKVLQKYVHHLVAEEFLNHNFKNKDLVINHINGNMLDNRVKNLEIVSRSQNASHWVKKNRSKNAGRKRTGFCGRGHKLKPNQYHCNYCRRLRSGNLILPPKEINWKEMYIKGYLISEDGKIWSKKTKRILKGGINTPGYKMFNLRIENKTKNFSISRLVYKTFIGPIPKDFVVDHINEDKFDNRVQNLRVLSKKENSLASKVKMRERGQHGFKLDNKKVSEIKWLLENTKMKQTEIAMTYHVVKSTISDIKLGHKWRHVIKKKPLNQTF